MTEEERRDAVKKGLALEIKLNDHYILLGDFLDTLDSCQTLKEFKAKINQFKVGFVEPPLEATCSKCCGNKVDLSTLQTCDQCNGSGDEMTALGRRVWDFVQRRLYRAVGGER